MADGLIPMSQFSEPETHDNDDYIIMLVDGLNAKIKKSDFLAAVTTSLTTIFPKTGGEITGNVKVSGILEVNSDGTPAPSVYIFSFPLHKSNRTITAIGHNIQPHPEISGSFLLKTNGLTNGGMMTAYSNNHPAEYKGYIPVSGDGTQDQVISISALEALLIEVPLPTA
jgi:hypothetical protein